MCGDQCLGCVCECASVLARVSLLVRVCVCSTHVTKLLDVVTQQTLIFELSLGLQHPPQSREREREHGGPGQAAVEAGCGP